eukprot:Em0013g174a
MVGLPLIPVGLILLEISDVEGRVLVYWRSSVSPVLSTLPVFGKILNWLWPTPTRVPRDTSQADPRRCGGLSRKKHDRRITVTVRCLLHRKALFQVDGKRLETNAIRRIINLWSEDTGVYVLETAAVQTTRL